MHHIFPKFFTSFLNYSIIYLIDSLIHLYISFKRKMRTAGYTVSHFDRNMGGMSIAIILFVIFV